MRLGGFENPGGWPEPVVPLLARALTCQYASLTRAGAPVTWPLTPYLNDDGHTVDVSTALTYPLKAERARRVPRVSLLFSDAVGLTLESPPVVLVEGRAAVRDRDLQANTDRYVAASLRKLPAAYRTSPWFVLKRHRWYWTRMWIEITPVRIRWWPAGRLDAEPHIWAAPDDLPVPESDPAPPGRSPGGWQTPASEWRDLAAYCLGRIGNPTLTTVVNGWPLPVPVREVKAAEDGFYVWLHDGVPRQPDGRVCVTFHKHAERFVGQENYSFVGDSRAQGGRLHVTIERRLGEFVLPESRIKRTRNFLSYARKLAPRLEAECTRRGEPVPEVRKAPVASSSGSAGAGRARRAGRRRSG